MTIKLKSNSKPKGDTTTKPKGNSTSHKNKNKNPTVTATTATITSTSKPPNWPPLIPTHPITTTTSLFTIDTLLPSQIYLIRNFFSASLCRTYISFLSSQIPLVTTPGGFRPKKSEAVRINDRFQIHDESFAKGLWERMGLEGVVRSFASDDQDVESLSGDPIEQRKNDEEEKGEEIWGGKVLGLNPNIRIYRYSAGQFFAKHYDESNTLIFDRQPAKTTFTLLIYLSVPAGGGGETVFYLDADGDDNTVYNSRSNKKIDKNKNAARTSNPISVAPEVGMALLHRHGDQCLLHEGKEVYAPPVGVDGIPEKWVIRSDLVVAR